MFCLLCRQTEEFPSLEEGEDGAASQSMSLDQEVALSQSDTSRLSQDVIVIITDTESDEEQEEEEEEQVKKV